MNYIKLINWFWDEVPYLKGYKGSYAALFFAIIDGINRNNWAADTPIAYDRLISKLKFSKQLYLDGRDWLFQNELIQFTPGQNAYHMAVFNVGLAVRNQTANLTGILTAERPLTLPVSLPNNKHINSKTSKPLNNIDALHEMNIPFISFYELYDKKVGAKKAEALWVKLTDGEREIAITHIPKYKEATQNKKYRKDPTTYLNNKSFNDEIINNNTDEKSITGPGGRNDGTGNSKQAGWGFAKSSLSESAGQLE